MQIIHGDALQVLSTFSDNTFDGIITDPPYSSGGQFMKDRAKPTGEKYVKSKCAPDFLGDNMDGHSWYRWVCAWLTDCLRVSKPGSPILVFSDWRQLPALTDALQWAGWTWRGIIPWDKKNCRPQRGRFKQQAEFIAWGSKGNLPVDRNVPILPGAYTYAAPAASKRLHQTEKPLELMRQLVRIVTPGGHILDPFMGSGTTLEAAVLEGYGATGIEKAEVYCRAAKIRLG